METNNYEQQLEKHIEKLERQLEEAEKEIDSISRENSQLRVQIDANSYGSIRNFNFVSFYFDEVDFSERTKKQFEKYVSDLREGQTEAEQLGKALSSTLLYIPDIESKTLDNLNRKLQSLKENKSELQIAYEEEIDSYEQ